MIETPDFARLVESYPVLTGLSGPATDRLRREASRLVVADGATVLHEPSPCRDLVLPVAGRLRIVKRLPEAREMVLYRVRPGEVCVLTISCLLGEVEFPAGAVVEEELVAYALPRPLFFDLVAESAEFREFVFSAFSRRLTEMMQLVEAVAVRRLDRRLATLLLERRSEGVVRATHQQLADELGSVREIVSRILKGFESEGYVRLGRGSLEILQPEGLVRLSD